MPKTVSVAAYEKDAAQIKKLNKEHGSNAECVKHILEIYNDKKTQGPQGMILPEEDLIAIKETAEKAQVSPEQLISAMIKTRGKFILPAEADLTQIREIAKTNGKSEAQIISDLLVTVKKDAYLISITEKATIESVVRGYTKYLKDNGLEKVEENIFIKFLCDHYSGVSETMEKK